MHCEVLRLRETVLAKEHRGTLMSIYNLDYLLFDRKRSTEANALYQTALNSCGKTLSSRSSYYPGTRNHHPSMLLEAQDDQEKRDILYQGMLGDDIES